MKNLLGDAPMTNESGHASYVRSFVLDEDLRGRDVLDIGCGFGWFERIALAAGCRTAVGVEPSETDLDTVRKHLSDPRCAFHAASAVALPFGDASFDTVVMWEVLEHIPKGTEAAAFAEVARVLRPGGALYLSTPHANVVARIGDPAWWVAGHRHYSTQQVVRFAEAAGLVVEVGELKAGLPQIFYMLDLYVAKWVFRRPPFFHQRALRAVERDWMREKGGFAHVLLRARRPQRSSSVS